MPSLTMQVLATTIVEVLVISGLLPMAVNMPNKGSRTAKLLYAGMALLVGLIATPLAINLSTGRF